MAADLRLKVLLDAVDKASKPLRAIMAGSKGAASALKAASDQLKQLTQAQRDVSGFRELKQATAATSTELAQAKARLHALSAEMRGSESISKKLTQQHKAAKNAVADLTLRHGQQQSKLNAVRSAMDKAGLSTLKLAQHEVRLKSEVGKANAALKLQKDRLSAIAAAHKRAAAMRGAGMTAVTHGAGAMLAGRQALRGAAAPVAAAMEFESAMADVRKVVNFDTPQQFADMGRDIEALSLSLPLLPADIAKIVAAAGQAGIARGELVRFASDAAQMAVAFDTSAEDAGQTMATWRTAFRLPQAAVIELADKINYLGNTGPANVQKISAVVNRIGALGEVAGLQSGPLAALGATVAGMGIQEEVAATGIKNMLLTLAAGDAATKKQRNALKDLGLAAADMATAMQDDAGGAILTVLQRLRELPAAAQSAALTRLFGRESVGAIAPLLTNLELLKDNFAKVAEAQSFGGSMGAEYAARVATASNALQLMKNSAVVLAQGVGATLLPDLKALSESLATITASTARWVREHPTLARWLARVLILGSALVTVVGGLVFAGGMAAMAFSHLVKAVATLSGGKGFMSLLGSVRGLATRAFPALLNVGRLLLPVFAGISAPVWLIGAALAAVAVVIWKYWAPIKAFFVGIWDGIAEGFQPVMTALRPALDALGGLLAPVIGFLGDVFDSLLAPVGDSAESLSSMAEVGRLVGNIISGVLIQPLIWLGKQIGFVAFQITSVLGGAWNTIMGLFTGDGTRLVGGLRAMFDSISELLGGWPAKMWEFGKAMLSGLIAGISSMAGAVKDAVVNAASRAAGWFAEKLGIHSPSRVFAGFGINTMQGLAQGLTGGQGEPLKAIDAMAGRMRQLGAGMALEGPALPQVATAQPATPNGDPLLAGVRTMLDAVNDLLNGLPAKFMQFGQHTLKGLAGGQGEPLKAIDAMAGRMRQLGAGMALGAGVAMPAAAFDARPPMAAGGAPTASAAPLTVNITINAGPGSDANAIARAVRAEIEKLERERSSRRNARLSDLE